MNKVDSDSKLVINTAIKLKDMVTSMKLYQLL